MARWRAEKLSHLFGPAAFRSSRRVLSPASGITYLRDYGHK